MTHALMCCTKLNKQIIPFLSRYLLNKKLLLCSVEINHFHNKKTTHSFYIKDSSAVEMLVRNIRKDQTRKDVFIVRDSVRGILTQHLLQLDKPLLLFKPAEILITKLRKLYVEKMKNVTVSDFDLNDLSKFFWKSKFDSNDKRSSQVVKVLKSFCEPSANLIIIEVTDSLKILYNIGNQYTHQELLFQDYLNPTFYLFIPYSLFCSFESYSRVMGTKRLWRLGEFMRTIFYITYLGSQPLNYFSVSKNYQARAERSSHPELYEICLIKMVPKDIKMMRELTGGNLLTFQYFVNYMLRQKNYVSLITTIEEFIPSCSEELIKEGFRMTDYPYKLSFEQWMQAFQIFTTHSEFPNCSFIDEVKRNYEDRDIIINYDDELLKDD